jgi:hypothetical protein
MFRKKKGQLDDQPLIEIERHHSVQDSRKFYKHMNDTRKPFEPGAVMCRATNGQLLTNKNQVLSRWKEYFAQHLNESSQEETHTNQQPLRENGVINDFSSHGKIVEAIKYLKDNKAVGLDSIAAKLLKSGGPSLLHALNEMIQPVCIGETLPESWTRLFEPL